MITVWILGAVMVTMSGALFTLTKSSDFARRQTLLEVELRHYAEAVRAAPYIPCAGATLTGGGARALYTPENIGYSPTGVVVTPMAQADVTFWEQASPTNLTIDTSKVNMVEGFTSAVSLRTNTLPVAGAPKTFATRDRCDPNPAVNPTDDGVQKVTVRLTDTGTPAATASMWLIKSCDAETACPGVT